MQGFRFTALSLSFISIILFPLYVLAAPAPFPKTPATGTKTYIGTNDDGYEFVITVTPTCKAAIYSVSVLITKAPDFTASLFGTLEGQTLKLTGTYGKTAKPADGDGSSMKINGDTAEVTLHVNYVFFDDVVVTKIWRGVALSKAPVKTSSELSSINDDSLSLISYTAKSSALESNLDCPIEVVPTDEVENQLESESETIIPASDPGNVWIQSDPKSPMLDYPNADPQTNEIVSPSDTGSELISPAPTPLEVLIQFYQNALH